MCVRQSVSIGGSGSSYVYGYVDANYKKNMTKEECAQFVTNSKSEICPILVFLIYYTNGIIFSFGTCHVP